MSPAEREQPLLDLGAIREREQLASDELARMCTAPGGPPAAWRWSIPANPKRDSDLILAASLADVLALLAEVDHLAAGLAAAREEGRREGLEQGWDEREADERSRWATWAPNPYRKVGTDG